MLILLRHWKLALAGVLLLAVGVQTIRVERLKAVVERLTGQNKALRLNLDQVAEATKQADKAAREAKAAAEAEYRAKAERIDREHQADLADARARANRYAAANRVRNPTNPSPTSSATPAPNGDGAGGAEQAGEDAVILSRPDFDVMVENTLRLKAAREWACSLDGAGCPPPERP